MRRRTAVIAAAVAICGAAAGGIAMAGGGPGSGLDDGAGLLPQAGITEARAVAAARTAASGGIGEVDLEHDGDGRLVFNVDVGAADVQVDAATGTVVRVVHDD